MAHYLLNLVYLAALILVSPWLLFRAARQGKYLQGLWTRWLGRTPVVESGGKVVWWHAVSVGEVNLLATLLAEARRRHPTWRCVVSTTTRTGYELARRKYPDLTVFYCPLDFTWAVRAAMRRVRPDLLVLAELELWPNLVWAARRAGARVAIVNGRLSQHSFKGYRRLRPLLAGCLKQIDLVAVQNEDYRQRFLELGLPAERCYITGSVKYDGAQTDRRNASTVHLRELADFAPADVVFLAGSTQEGEEAAAVASFRALTAEFPRLRLVLVPRHAERFAAVKQLLANSGLAWQARSRLETDGPDPQARVLVVDTIGELGAWWGTAQIAFVGGSLGKRGGQNMIEPAAYGAAVCFGPNTRNFRDIVAALIEQRAAVVVNDQAELTAFVRRALVEPGFADALGRRAQRFVASQLGATGRSMDRLSRLIEPPPQKGARAA